MSNERLTGDVDALAGWLRTLRIIVFALVMGIVAYGGFVVSQNLGKPHTLATGLSLTSIAALVGGLITLVLGSVAPRFILAAGNLPSDLTISPVSAPSTTTAPDRLRPAILQRLQSSTIIAAAFFDGGAFGNLAIYAQTRELLHLILAGILALAILALFPTRSRVQQRMDDMLRQAKDEGSFART